MNPNLLTLESAAQWRAELDSQGKQLVLTNGCFDLLHAGHVRYLAQARALGDALLVAINADQTVRTLKGRNRPLFPAEDRAEILAGLESVGRVVVFDELSATRTIEAIRPHIYAKGGDYTPDTLIQEERQFLDRAGIRIEILGHVPGLSTSAALANLQPLPDPGERKIRLGVLGSGKGSNFGAIAGAIVRGELNAEIRVVISDVAGAGILRHAETLGISAIPVEPGDRHAQLSLPAQNVIIDRLEAERVDLVILAGFMRILKDPLLSRFEGRILNIHPSLLPAFPGRDSWVQALEAGVAETGCTVHVVTAKVDAGPILAQARVPILPDDTAETLHQRIHQQEHRIYPRAIAEFDLGAITP